MISVKVWKTNEGRIIYVCRKCGTHVLVLPDDSETGKLTGCKHFKWEVMSYTELPIIAKDVVIDIIRGKKVYVLRERQS
jgi:hypothetical protein